MKKYDYVVFECRTGEFEDELKRWGKVGWEYCQTIVNQHLVTNKITNRQHVDIKYLVIMKKEIKEG